MSDSKPGWKFGPLTIKRTDAETRERLRQEGKWVAVDVPTDDEIHASMAADDPRMDYAVAWWRARGFGPRMLMLMGFALVVMVAFGIAAVVAHGRGPGVFLAAWCLAVPLVFFGLYSVMKARDN